MFCKECGKMIQDGNKFCTGCGSKIEPIGINRNTEQNYNGNNNNNYTINYSYNTQSNNEDKNSIGLNVLAFFVPVVGLILFLVWKKQYPKKSKSIGICALIGYILSCLATVVYMLWISSLFNKLYDYDLYDYYKYNNYDNYYEFEDYYMNEKYDI